MTPLDNAEIEEQSFPAIWMGVHLGSAEGWDCLDDATVLAFYDLKPSDHFAQLLSPCDNLIIMLKLGRVFVQIGDNGNKREISKAKFLNLVATAPAVEVVQ